MSTPGIRSWNRPNLRILTESYQHCIDISCQDNPGNHMRPFCSVSDHCRFYFGNKKIYLEPTNILTVVTPFIFSTDIYSYIEKYWTHNISLTWHERNFTSLSIFIQLIIVQHSIVWKDMLSDIIIHYTFEKVWIRYEVNHL